MIYEIKCKDLKELILYIPDQKSDLSINNTIELIKSSDDNDFFRIVDLLYYYLVGNYAIKNTPNVTFDNNKIKNVIFIGFSITKGI